VFVERFVEHVFMQEEANSVFVSKKAEWLEQEINLHIKFIAKISSRLGNAMLFRYTWSLEKSKPKGGYAL
jgi:hypothetical protein